MSGLGRCRGWGPRVVLLLLGAGCVVPTPRGLEPPAALAESEVRSIDALPYVVEHPGRYRLTGDLQGTPGEDGIVVRCDRVDIDLGGFELRGGESTRDGIRVDGHLRDLRVHGGTISWWGHDGVHAPGVRGARFADLEIVNGGGHGLIAGEDCRVLRCRASYNWFGRGIELGDDGRVEACTVSHNGHGGLRLGRRGVVVGLRSVRNTYGPGAVLGEAGSIEDSVLWRNDREGLLGSERVRVRGVVAEGNLGGGLVVGAESIIEDSVALADRDGPGFTLGRGGLLRSGIAADNFRGPLRAGADLVVEGLRLADGTPLPQVGEDLGPGAQLTGLEARDLEAAEALGLLERLERPDAGRPTLDGSQWDWRLLLDPENPNGLAPPWARRWIPLDTGSSRESGSLDELELPEEAGPVEGAGEGRRGSVEGEGNLGSEN